MNSTPKDTKLFDELMMCTDFKEYLDKTGALDALRSALDSLWNEPEWPQNPQDYIRKKLAIICGAAPDPLVELKNAREKLAKLKKEKLECREKLALKYALEAAARKSKENPQPKKRNRKRHHK